jgi:hypothetical protein
VRGKNLFGYFREGELGDTGKASGWIKAGASGGCERGKNNKIFF